MIRHFRKKEEVLRNTFDIISKLTGRGSLIYNYELNHKFSMYFNYVAIFSSWKQPWFLIWPNLNFLKTWMHCSLFVGNILCVSRAHFQKSPIYFCILFVWSGISFTLKCSGHVAVLVERMSCKRCPLSITKSLISSLKKTNPMNLFFLKCFMARVVGMVRMNRDKKL